MALGSQIHLGRVDPSVAMEVALGVSTVFRSSPPTMPPSSASLPRRSLLSHDADDLTSLTSLTTQARQLYRDRLHSIMDGYGDRGGEGAGRSSTLNEEARDPLLGRVRDLEGRLRSMIDHRRSTSTRRSRHGRGADHDHSVAYDFGDVPDYWGRGDPHAGDEDTPSSGTEMEEWPSEGGEENDEEEQDGEELNLLPHAGSLARYEEEEGEETEEEMGSPISFLADSADEESSEEQSDSDESDDESEEESDESEAIIVDVTSESASQEEGDSDETETETESDSEFSDSSDSESDSDDPEGYDVRRDRIRLAAASGTRRRRIPPPDMGRRGLGA